MIKKVLRMISLIEFIFSRIYSNCHLEIDVQFYFQYRMMQMQMNIQNINKTIQLNKTTRFGLLMI